VRGEYVDVGDGCGQFVEGELHEGEGNVGIDQVVALGHSDGGVHVEELEVLDEVLGGLLVDEVALGEQA